MTSTLKDLYDRDGLVNLADIVINSDNPRDLHIKRTGEKVFVSPYAFDVIDLVARRQDLVACAKFRLEEKELGRKGLRIFGVNFECGLAKVAKVKPGLLLKSLYRAIPPNGDLDLDWGIYATLVTHIQRAPDYIEIEAWQITGPGTETFYLHGMLDLTLLTFIHLDGATMRHDAFQSSRLFQNGEKIKGDEYQKWFRLDGSITREDGVAIAKAYFGVEPLLEEYFEMDVKNVL